MSKKFEYPKYWNLPPFFTVQPVVETQKKQCELWGDLILAYCQANKIYDVQVSEAVTKLPIFHNKTINRKLDASQLTVFLDYLAEKGNVEWKDKKKTSCFIYFRTPKQWGAQIYKWALDQGKANTICTVYEIQEGEDAEEEEFYKIDSDTLMKALQALEKEGKAQIFAGSSAENLGVKFFGP